METDDGLSLAFSDRFGGKVVTSERQSETLMEIGWAWHRSVANRSGGENARTQSFGLSIFLAAGKIPASRPNIDAETMPRTTKGG